MRSLAVKTRETKKRGQEVLQEDGGRSPLSAQVAQSSTSGEANFLGINSFPNYKMGWNTRLQQLRKNYENHALEDSAVRGNSPHSPAGSSASG